MQKTEGNALLSCATRPPLSNATLSHPCPLPCTPGVPRVRCGCAWRRLEGKAIAVRWRPSAFLPVPFRTTTARSMIPIASVPGGQVLMVPNVLEILEDIVALGQGLVTGAEPIR